MAIAPALLAVTSGSCVTVQPFGAPAAGRWTSRAGLGIPRDDFGLASDGKRLFAVGGMTGERGNGLDAVEVYDPAADAWQRGAKLPQPMSSTRAAVVLGRLLVAGGARDDAEVVSSWSLDIRQDGARWNATAPLDVARLGHGLATLGDAAYAAGGLARGEPIASVERHDTKRDVWERVAPLPSARFNLALVAAGKALYAIGGSGTDRKPTTLVDVYDPERDKWFPGSALPEPMSNFGAALLGTRLHALLHGLHYVLDVQRSPRGPWERLAPLPTPRHGLGVVGQGGRLYAAGGCLEDPQRDVRVLEVFTP